MQVIRIPLRTLRSSDQPRQLVTEHVDGLAASIKEVGLIQPIAVRAASVMDRGLVAQGHQIVAGHHRVAAARALGWEEIDAVLVEVDQHLQAELIEIDENLQRAELTAAQRSKAIKRRKEIWEALHPNSGKTLSTIDRGPGRPKEFAADTAKSSGMTKQAINQHVARADALGDDIDRVVGTSLDKGVELDALKAMPAAQRDELIARAQAGAVVSARERLPTRRVRMPMKVLEAPSAKRPAPWINFFISRCGWRPGAYNKAIWQSAPDRHAVTAAEETADRIRLSVRREDGDAVFSGSATIQWRRFTPEQITQIAQRLLALVEVPT